MFKVDFPVVLVSIFWDVFAMGTFLAGFIRFALVVPFGVAVAIFLDACAVVLLLVTAAVFACTIFADAFAVVFLLDVEKVFVAFAVVIFVSVLCPF